LSAARATTAPVSRRLAAALAISMPFRHPFIIPPENSRCLKHPSWGTGIASYAPRGDLTLPRPPATDLLRGRPFPHRDHVAQHATPQPSGSPCIHADAARTHDHQPRTSCSRQRTARHERMSVGLPPPAAM
jgi:hypothetical protein